MDPSNEQKPGWAFRPGNETESESDFHPPSTEVPNETSPQNQAESISWTASEFVDNHKTAGWYIKLMLAILAIAVLSYLLTRDLISASVIVVVGFLFAILASKKPRQMTYRIDNAGISIGNNTYPFHTFKSFAIVEEGAIGCINLLPLKRFMPELSIYYPPEEEAKIIDVLSASLPNDQRQEHSFDRLMKKIRF